MRFKRGDREFELLKGSDASHDTVYLELNEMVSGNSHTVLFGEKTEGGAYRFLSLQHIGGRASEPILLPLELVEEFIGWMKNML